MKAFKQVNLVTCDADFHVYRNGLLVVNEDKIVYCGNEDATCEARADETVDCEGAWLMPGLVNCHTHSAMIVQPIEWVWQGCHTLLLIAAHI